MQQSLLVLYLSFIIVKVIARLQAHMTNQIMEMEGGPRQISRDEFGHVMQHYYTRVPKVAIKFFEKGAVV